LRVKAKEPLVVYRCGELLTLEQGRVIKTEYTVKWDIPGGGTTVHVMDADEVDILSQVDDVYETLKGLSESK